ncbi:MAG TPA: Rid family detoxifying hydrolase [Miltoncostaea sp.]|nr:Rid family detoxifying hydrolase [Miltoncostaea sp.]
MRTIRTESAPAPVQGAPYSQAAAAAPGDGEVVWVSGQLGIDPGDGTLVADDVAEQTALALRHIVAILAAAGGGLADVVKTTVYLTDLAGDFPAMNEVYGRAFAGSAPARATVGVAALPLGARVEIEAVAVIRPR